MPTEPILQLHDHRSDLLLLSNPRDCHEWSHQKMDMGAELAKESVIEKRAHVE
jgi:hypothetical protein